jgi:hypothetical protein
MLLVSSDMGGGGLEPNKTEQERRESFVMLKKCLSLILK